MLSIKNLTKKYKNTLAVDDVSFDLNEGRISILIGPNGAGKSTIIKSVASLIRYDGEIKISNFKNTSLDAKKIFSYVPEIPAVFSALKVSEHLEFYKKVYNKSIPEEKLNEYIKSFEMEDNLDKMGEELSKGMSQKVSILMALITDPQFIMLDEPMVGLDPHAIRELKKILLELKKDGRTILISTHMLEMVEDIWDDAILIKSGKILGRYKREDYSNKELKEIFFELTENSGDKNE